MFLFLFFFFGFIIIIGFNLYKNNILKKILKAKYPRKKIWWQCSFSLSLVSFHNPIHSVLRNPHLLWFSLQNFRVSLEQIVITTLEKSSPIRNNISTFSGLLFLSFVIHPNGNSHQLQLQHCYLQVSFAPSWKWFQAKR